MAEPARTNLFNAITTLDKLFNPIKNHAQDLISAATLRVDDQGLPVELDLDGNQPGFHPFAAMLVATTIAWAVLGIANMVCNVAVPYSIRSHVMFATKIAVGACLFHLIGTAITSIRQLSQGQSAKPLC